MFRLKVSHGLQAELPENILPPDFGGRSKDGVGGPLTIGEAVVTERGGLGFYLNCSN